MKNKLLYALFGAIAFSVAFAAAYAYALTSADRLEKDSLLCLTPVSLDEARKALDAKDDVWAASIRSCILTNYTLKVRVLGCDMSSCLIRYFDQNGGVGYAEHRSLYTN